MNAEVRKIRRGLILGALLSPVLVMLWLSAGFWMEPKGWLGSVFLMFFALLICESAKTSPREVLAVAAKGVDRGKEKRNATLVWIVAWSFWLMTNKSPTLKEILGLLSEKGVDWQLLSGLMMLGFWIAVIRFRNVRDITDEQIAPYAEARRLEKEEKRKKAMEPVEY